MSDKEAPPRKRMSYLSVDQMRSLDHWCHLLRMSFGEIPFLVGSAITRPDYRDVDIRIPLDDGTFDTFPMDVGDLNMLLSRWGKQMTGLPIDCQVQRLSEFRSHGDRAYPRFLASELRTCGQTAPDPAVPSTEPTP